jgi:hypothetical protein
MIFRDRTQQADFFFLLRSCERVSLGSEESLLRFGLLHSAIADESAILSSLLAVKRK